MCVVDWMYENRRVCVSTIKPGLRDFYFGTQSSVYIHFFTKGDELWLVTERIRSPVQVVLGSPGQPRHKAAAPVNTGEPDEVV